MKDEPADSTTAFAFTEPARTPPAAPPARYAWVPWSLVLVLCGTMLWFAARDGASRRPAGPTEPPPSNQPGPRFEEWKDGELVAELMGFESVVAVRWTGGFLTGWVEFDDHGRQPMSFPFSFLDTEDARPESISGHLVVGRRPAEQPDDPDDAWVFVRVEWMAGKNEDGSVDRRFHSSRFHGALKVHRKRETREDGVTATLGAGAWNELRDQHIMLGVVKDADDDAKPVTWFDVGISPERPAE